MLDIESTALIQLLIAERSAEKPGLKELMQDVTEECERSGKEAYEVIDNFGLFTKDEMLQIMADNLGSYVWDPRGMDITQDIITLIDVDFARKHGVIPIAADDDKPELIPPFRFVLADSQGFFLYTATSADDYPVLAQGD
jgi:type IV pilus assembly protein PilB